MKKSFLLLAFTFVCMLTFAQRVDASSCYYGQPSPDLYVNGSWRKEPTRKLTTTADSCYGTNASVIFSPGSHLPMGRFYIHARLYEEDPDGNDDEMVKTYRGYNPNTYDLVSWEVISVDTPGKIDSTGDQTCELYMKFQIEDIDNSTAPFKVVKANLFKYTMCMS